MARHPDPAALSSIVRLIAVLSVSVSMAFALAGCAPSTGAESEPEFAEQAPPPPSEPWVGGPAYTVVVDPAWAERAAEATGIPLTAMLAYAGAAAAAENVAPGCGIGWNTLAAIGLVESDHGRHDGSVVAADGRVEPPIYGVPLDGNGVAEIRDTDGGAIDGTAEIDRAVGPLQLIPATWASWNIDGSGDNIPDPQNIYDAALAAANYLCHAGGNLTTASGWRVAISAYNAGEAYHRSVAEAASRYGEDVAALSE